jgi:hypothetical protein
MVSEQIRGVQRQHAREELTAIRRLLTALLVKDLPASMRGDLHLPDFAKAVEQAEESVLWAEEVRRLAGGD